MQRRIIMLGGLLQLLGGCTAQAMGIMRRGENAGYVVINVGPLALEDVDVVDAANPERSYAGQSGQPSGIDPGFKHAKNKRIAAGNNRYMSDTGHKVPEAVLISWREMPAPGGQPYTGTLVGPFKILVRSKIPPAVLDQARKETVHIDIGFTSGMLPPIMQWRLISDLAGSDSVGNPKIIAEGGDEFP
jgi:hypothetical protein